MLEYVEHCTHSHTHCDTIVLIALFPFNLQLLLIIIAVNISYLSDPTWRHLYWKGCAYSPYDGKK